MGFEYVAVPWPAQAADPQPEMRETLERIGFRLLGGCALSAAAQRDVRRTAASYGASGPKFEHWAAQPGQVLTAPTTPPSRSSHGCGTAATPPSPQSWPTAGCSRP